MTQILPFMDIKIYEHMSLRVALITLLNEGYLPATLKEVWKLKKEGKIPLNRFDTRTVFLEGEIRDATIEDLRNLEGIYEKGGYLLYHGGYGGYADSYYGGLGSVSRDTKIGDLARFAGIKL